MIELIWRSSSIYHISSFIFIYIVIIASTVCATNVITQDILMPGVKPSKPDHYLCTIKPVNAKEAYIVKMEAKAEASRAHHILLFACSFYLTNKDYWDCGEGFVCPDMKIMFAWAKNAPPTTLPENVGFRIGSDNKVNFLVLQVHYATPTKDLDTSGLTLQMTYQPQAYLAGIFLLVAMSTVIPPHKEVIHGDVNCKFSSNRPIHAFAYRVHTHKLGVVVSGYRVSHSGNSNKVFTEIAKGNPQWPQAFYPMTQLFTVHKNDYLVARCTFNSTLRDTETTIGSTTNDEMCNLYIMYYTDIDEGRDFYECMDVNDPNLVAELPADSDKPLPRNPVLEEHAMGVHHSKEASLTASTETGKARLSALDSAMILPDKKGHKFESNLTAANGGEYPDFDDSGKSSAESPGSYNYYDVSRGHIHHLSSSTSRNDLNPKTFVNGTPEGKGILDWFSPAQRTSLFNDVPNWPQLSVDLGQVTSVAFDTDGNIVIFHRGNAVWGFSTFTLKNVYTGDHNDPISTDTIITIDKNTGQYIKSWGKKLFFMPHGLFVDGENNVWVTDVALHQVFKFSSNGDVDPLMAFGERFFPGNDNDHFCKPSSVVVTKNGEFYISDGYCNNRILKYSAKGELLLQWGQATRSVLGFIGIKLGARLPPYAFDVPHDLALAEDKGLIFVADRENGRIQAFYLSNGTFHSQILDSEFGGRLFAMTYSPVNGGLLYAVNGPTTNFWKSGVKGFVIQLNTCKIIGLFTPLAKAMSNPHDIVVTPDGSTLYVAEIGPNRIIKFIADVGAEESRQNSGLRVNEKVLVNASYAVVSSMTEKPVAETVQITKVTQAEDSKAVQEKVDENKNTGLFGNSSFSASMIIMSLLAIPVLLMITIAVVIRCRKRKFHNCSVGHVKGWMTGYNTPDADRFVIGNLLKNKHKGFDRVSMEDSDIDDNESDSDVEEYTVSAQKA